METPFPFHRPARGPEMCGRDAEIAHITRAVEAGAPVAVTAGLSGLGLTSLALALRHRLSGSASAAYLDLWPAEGPSTLHRAVSRSGDDAADGGETAGRPESGAAGGPNGGAKDGSGEGGAGAESGDRADPGGWLEALLSGALHAADVPSGGSASADTGSEPAAAAPGAAPRGPPDGPAVLLLDGAEWLATEEARAPAEALEEAVRHGDVLPVLFARSGGGGDGANAGGNASDGGGLASLLEAPASTRDGGGGGPGEGDAPPSSGERLALGRIPFRAWLPYVLERFLETDRWIANEHVEEAVRFTGGHPRYTQHLLHLVWSACGPDGRVSDQALRQARRDLLAREDPALGALWATLSPNQRRVAWGLALETEPSPYSAGFVERWDLASPSSVQRALSSLQEAGIVDKEEGSYAVRDPLLPRWLRWRWRSEATVTG